MSNTCLTTDEILGKLALPEDIVGVLGPPFQSLGYKLQPVKKYDLKDMPVTYYRAVDGSNRQPLTLFFIEDLADENCVNSVLPVCALFQGERDPVIVFSRKNVHGVYSKRLTPVWEMMGPQYVRLFGGYELGLFEKVKDDPDELRRRVKEYMELQDAAPVAPPPAPPAPPPKTETVKIFVSYSHKDKKYLADESLIGFLSGLKDAGAEFWWDEGISTGDKWDDVIQQEISACHIALLLISQNFLNSTYIKKSEVANFLKRAETENNLRIYPVMLSPCTWTAHEWLKARQFIPPGNKTIETDFKDEGDLKRLFLEIYTELQAEVDKIRGAGGGG